MSEQKDIDHIKEVLALHKEIAELRDRHNEEKAQLTDKLNTKAVDAAFAASISKSEESNHKYSLLKDQYEEMKRAYATHGDIDKVGVKVEVLNKYMWKIVGAMAVINVLLVVALALIKFI